MVRFNCTSCNKKLVVPDEHIGKKGKCPSCGQTNVVPTSSPGQTDAVDGFIEEMLHQEAIESGDQERALQEVSHQSSNTEVLAPKDWRVHSLILSLAQGW